MIKKFFVATALLTLGFCNAQEGSTSPYSFFGIGDLRFRGEAEYRSMGGMSIYTDSVRLNLRNPASFGGLKFTTYTAGISYGSLNLKTDTSDESSSTTTFDYLALGVPVSEKGGFGFGILPYTSVGYRLQSLDESVTPSVLTRYTGEGGLNRVFFSAGYEIFKGLAIGATVNYDFGRIENKILQIRDSIQIATRELNRSDLSGFDFNFSINYQAQLTNKLRLRTSLIYNPEGSINSENTRQLSTVIIGVGGREIPTQTFEIDLDAAGLRKTQLVLPSSITFGAGIGQERKWFVGGEFELKKTSNFENRFINISRQSLFYEDGERFSAGAFYLPDYNSFTSYWKRVVYRIGLHNERTGLVVNNVPVHDFGMSFGLGMPLGYPNNLNIGFEFGKRGSTFQGRIEENYFNINIGLSLNDKWFIKRKYD